MIAAAALARFWAKVDKSGPVPSACPDLGSCWNWTASKTGDGYGRFKLGADVVLAHRLSLRIASGDDPPPSVQACHRCDNRSCVNPAHLFWGSNADNQRDAFAKGRNSVRVDQGGSKNGHAKITEAQALEIVERRAAGEPRSQLAIEFGVSYGAIWSIETGKTWKTLSPRREGPPADTEPVKRAVAR